MLRGGDAKPGNKRSYFGRLNREWGAQSTHELRSTNRALMRGNTPSAEAARNDSEPQAPTSAGQALPHSGEGGREGRPSPPAGGWVQERHKLQANFKRALYLWGNPVPQPVGAAGQAAPQTPPLQGDKACSDICIK